MLTADGPRVLEFNCRFGDPETQSMLPLLEGDLLGALAAAAAGDLAGTSARPAPRAAVTVIVAGGEYPERNDAGSPIEGIEAAEAAGAIVFHAGTARHGDRLVTNGGRILGVTGVADDLEQARALAYAGAAAISFAGRPVPHRHRAPGRRPALADPVVGILVGSESDRERMQAAMDELDARGIAHEFEVRSAHRTPDAVAEYAKSARERGLRVLICGAGLAAALPGVVAAHTDLPVIGVPLRSSKSVLDGLDALLSIVQMPPGVPVACVGVDNAKNAAVLAARILGSS